MKFNFDTWKCPKCGYVVTDTEMQAFKYDYGCPVCKKSFSYFIPQPTESPNKSLDLSGDARQVS